ncbi:MAG TPA: SPOR domain-containing protein, partial [Pyrinomonadaceae bacterium]|nr:SPOR domain-containing protein [Pyrinomonadaceae bacterium]
MRPQKLIFTIIIAVIVALPANAGFLSFPLLPGEPMIRVGLMTNVASVTITTADTQLVARSPEEPERFLATNRVTVSARAYRPDEVEQFIFEIQNIASSAEADEIAKDVREATGETAIASIDTATNTWRVWIGKPLDSKEEADAFKVKLAENGFPDVAMRTETRTVVSPDAVALSQQVRTAGRSQVRSLIRPTGLSAPTAASADDLVPGLREVIVNGASAEAKYGSLKAVSFGSFDERANPVRLNGKAYRGKIEV